MTTATWSSSPGCTAGRSGSSGSYREGSVDFHDTPEEAAFRAELRSWLSEHWAGRPLEGGRGDFDALRRWGGELYDAGYVGLTWPSEYGGRGRSPPYPAVSLAETVPPHAPWHPGGIGPHPARP